ncbi:MAG: hypothetical protein SFV81_23595 [Pirellulaceae bacterium]|nr:hypothetical protein [Pirellulaceae bacterium]
MFTLLFIISVASAQLFGIGVHDNDYVFYVIADKPYVMRSAEPKANLCNLCTRSGRDQLIHFRGDEELLPLCYALDGDNPVVVFNTNKQAQFCDEWDLSALPDIRSNGAPIKAVQGKFKGWYLDWSDKEIEVVEDGKTKHVRELILVKEPKAVRKFWKFPIAP